MSETIEVRNPATGDRLGEVQVADAAAVGAAVARVRAAQAAWAARPLGERCRVLLDVKRRIITRADDLAALLVAEMGKPRTEALSTEIVNLVGLVDYFATEAPRILAPDPIPLKVLKHKASYLHFPPRGVVGVISPWNFPLSLMLGPTIMALLAGNGVVAKPSEYTPLTADLAREILLEGGVPPDLVAVVHGYGATGAALVQSGVDMLVFTGSVATGRRVAAACGERLVPCITELGGKAAALVLPDADLDRTAAALRWGAFANAGQVCASVERVLVHKDVYQPLLDRLVPLVAEIVTGDPADPATWMGPLNNARQLQIVRALVDDAAARGAQVIQPAPAPSQGPGTFFPPTILAPASPEMRVMNEETFGPVMPLMPMDDLDAMVAEANRSPLGLLAYVFSRDKEKARAVAERIEAGTVMLNDVLMTHGLPETPWGGVKASGIGHTHSDQGLRDLCQQRHVHYDLVTPFRRELWWYPYGDRASARLKRLMGAVYGQGIGARVRALLQS